MPRSIGNLSRKNNTAEVGTPPSVRRSRRRWRSCSSAGGKSTVFKSAFRIKMAEALKKRWKYYMDANVRRVGIARVKAKTYYERWMDQEGIPIVEGFGVRDVRRISLQP